MAHFQFKSSMVIQFFQHQIAVVIRFYFNENPEEENKDTLSLEQLNLIRTIAEQSCTLDSDIAQINLMLEQYLSLSINDL